MDGCFKYNTLSQSLYKVAAPNVSSFTVKVPGVLLTEGFEELVVLTAVEGVDVLGQFRIVVQHLQNVAPIDDLHKNEEIATERSLKCQGQQDLLKERLD